MFETDLEAWLRAQPALAALVGARISHNAPPGETKPYIVFSRSDTRAERTLAGDVGQAVVQVDFDVWGASAAQAGDAAAALRTALSAINAAVRAARQPVVMNGGTRVHSAARGAEQDSYGSDTREFQRIVSATFRIDEE